MEAALCALQQGNVDVGVLQETNIAKGIYTPYGTGYAVWATQADIRHRGGGGSQWRGERKQGDM